MPKTLTLPIDVEIRAAYAELLEARAECTRSPNADSIRTEEYAELRMNKLLDRRCSLMASA